MSAPSSGPCSCCSGPFPSRVLRRGQSTSLCQVGTEAWRVIVPFREELQSGREGRKSKGSKGLERRRELSEGSMLQEQIALGARGALLGRWRWSQSCRMVPVSLAKGGRVCVDRGTRACVWP